MSKLLARLKGGDRRSIGQSDVIVRLVLSNEAEFETLVSGLNDGDPLVRMRASDACEKVSRVRPEWLWPHKKQLLDIARSTSEQELKWHLAQMLPRLHLTAAERLAAIAMLRRFLRDPSRIVRVSALQAFADLSTEAPTMRRQLPVLLTRFKNDQSPSVRARARKLLEAFKFK